MHRDVSPQNLLLGLDGMTRVTDFGIAKATMRPGVTQDGALKGKLAYMAPEYVGENALDARSDVFALGAVLWELLVGRKLFKGNSEVDTLQLVARAEVPRISAANPSVGTALDDVMTSALAKAPADRFTSARAFANALETAARRAGLVAAHDEVGTLVREATRERLAERREKIKARAKELDALTMGGSTTTEELAAAVERAQEQIANESPAEAPPPTLREPDSAQSSSASAQIAASQVSFVTERASEARPAASSSRRWAWAFALLSGALAAAVLLLWFNDSASSPSDRSQSSAAPLAPSSPVVATLVTPSAPPASSSAAAPRSSNLGSATASAPPKPPSKPLLPPPVAAPTATSPAIAPNPYRR